MALWGELKTEYLHYSIVSSILVGMKKIIQNLSLILLCFTVAACSRHLENQPIKQTAKVRTAKLPHKDLIVGAERFSAYLPLLKDKTIAVVANNSSRIGEMHLVDALQNKNINIAKVFAPEHGFRGNKDAGEVIKDAIDIKTGLPIISLYGVNKKPSPQSLQGIDTIVFDIQDVGVRFYTYLSTLHYVMESCADNAVPLIVLDRPNPNGFYIDGPVLKPSFSSFIGLHPVPLVYGMTIGEYAQMINGEQWLKGGKKCELTVIKISGYTHKTRYKLPVIPSPNLPNMTAVYLYPSLALFEGTTVSVGRGTDFPFQIIGHPEYPRDNFQFTPTPNAGAKYPKLNGSICKGIDLRRDKKAGVDKGISLHWLLQFYRQIPNQNHFFLENNYFNKLAGNASLMQQIKQGKTESEIKASWEDEIKSFKIIRRKYLLYE